MREVFNFTNININLDSQRYLRESGIVSEGAVLLVSGPSGIGKTTLLKALARLLPCNSGEAKLRGQSWDEFSPMQWRSRICYFPQKSILFDGTVDFNLKMPFKLKMIKQKIILDEEKIYKYLDSLGLYPEILTQNVNTLSGGEATRIAFIRSILLKPDILLLDEPTANLDKENRGRLYSLLQLSLNQAEINGVILVTHLNDDLDRLNNLKTIRLQSRKKDTDGQL